MKERFLLKLIKFLGGLFFENFQWNLLQKILIASESYRYKYMVSSPYF